MGLWIGTYQGSGGGGLYPLAVDGPNLRVGAPEPRIANASFGVWSDRHNIAYFVDEQEAGRVTAWRCRNGKWEELGARGSGGAMPCYLVLHPHGTLLAVANYADGSVSLLDLDAPTGLIRELTDVKRSSGRGSDPDRQAGPHAHCALFSEDGQWLFHVDLGLDRVFRYRVEGTKLGAAEAAFEAPPGSGPRHLMLHPDGSHAFLLCELSAELMLLERTANRLVCLHSETTLPEEFTGKSLGGHIGLDPGTGDVIVTHRGHNSLISFALGKERLERRGWARTGGASPRHFWTDGKLAVVANEEDGSVALLRLPAPDDAGASPLQVAEVPGAAFVIDIPDGQR